MKLLTTSHRLISSTFPRIASAKQGLHCGRVTFLPKPAQKSNTAALLNLRCSLLGFRCDSAPICINNTTEKRHNCSTSTVNPQRHLYAHRRDSLESSTSAALRSLGVNRALSRQPIRSPRLTMAYTTMGGRFNVVKHNIPAFPIREFVRGVFNEGDQLQLAVNQYKPVNNPEPKSGDLTLIVAHANAFHKELYEPFFEYLVDDYEKRGVKLRGIWIADMFCQGESGVLNETKLGGDVSWFDHTRDVLAMIMAFPKDIVQPIAGIGHSMGGAQLFRLSQIHPNLFTCVIGIDPVINDLPGFPSEANPVKMSAKRRDIWPSREEATKFFKSRPFYQSWDSRVLDLHMKYGLRNVPTAIYPDASKIEGGENAVTLTTTKHQEVFTFFRAAINERKDPKDMFRWLPDMTVPVCYIQGGTSVVNWGDSNKKKMETTPKPCEMHIIEDCGHLVPMERPKEAGELASEYLHRQLKIWGKKTEEYKNEWPSTLTIRGFDFDEKPAKAKM